jgi:hypothetical protein
MQSIKCIKFLIGLSLLLFGINARAGLFGPSNFEDCVSDGKVGRSNGELFQHMKSCQKKFPKLPSIKDGNNKSISCIFSGSNDVYTAQYNKRNNTASFNGKPENVIIFTDEKLVLGAGGNKPTIEINYLNGELKFLSLYAKCSEDSGR